MNSSKGAYLLVMLMAFSAQFCIAQESAIVPDLAKIVEGENWKVANREAEIVEEEDRLSVHFEGRPGNGIVWLKDIEFTHGTIEADIKGRDVEGKSFVGIAFRGVDENTQDAVYFRPFNFMSDDPVRRDHCVQYVSHPDYPWYRLREEHPEEYENPIHLTPDPNSFFHAKIIIEESGISVYVNDAKEPCLVVEELTDRSGGWVGFYMGHESAGTFANLKITPSGK